MEQVKLVLNGSLFWRALMALCLWFGDQWRSSGIVRWFLHPKGWGAAASESSLFFKVWALIRGALCRLYQLLRLDKLFAGSVFLHSWLWCAIPVVVAPALCVFRPSLLVLGLAAISYCSLLLVLVRDKNRPLTWSPINRYIILYAAVYLAGTLFSVNLKASLEPGLLTVAFILFPIALYNSITNRSQLDTLVALVVLVGTLISFYGILQYIFRWGYQSAAWVDSDMFSGISFRVPSTLENPNMLGQYLLLTIPLGGACLLSAKTWGRRIFYLCCCGIMCLCMILTFSRGAWLALLFAGVVFVLFLNPRLILLAPFALIALYFVLPDTVISRFTSIGDLTDNSTSYRVYIWMGVLAMLKDYWLCGIGPGDAAFNAVYPAYSYNGIVAPHSHNLFLQIVCDAGIAALAVFVILLFVYFRMMCSAFSREKDWTSRMFQTACISGVCGFMVQAMTDYSFYNYRLMFFFWAFLALGAASARRSQLPEGRLLA